MYPLNEYLYMLNQNTNVQVKKINNTQLRHGIIIIPQDMLSNVFVVTPRRMMKKMFFVL